MILNRKYFKKGSILIICYLFLFQNLYCEIDSISYNRLAILGASTVGAFTIGQVMQYDNYWSNRSDFHIMPWENEYKDALLADKLGHFYFTYALGKTYSKALQWTGLGEEKSVWIGSGVSLLHQSYVEINDGFSEGKIYLGFSRGDMIANILGASLPIFQYYNNELERIRPKISFHKSDNFDKNAYSFITHDYESTYHWLSLEIFDLLFGNSALDYFSLSIGHSVVDIDRLGSGHHALYLSIDLNWNKIRQLEFIKANTWLDSIIELLDKYKMPTFSLEISNQIKFYLFR